jgi:hypothetical protein
MFRGAAGGLYLCQEWKDIALAHRLRPGDHLLLCLRLGTAEILIRVFGRNRVWQLYPLLVADV